MCALYPGILFPFITRILFHMQLYPGLNLLGSLYRKAMVSRYQKQHIYMRKRGLLQLTVLKA
jgi:hypothetical protein